MSRVLDARASRVAPRVVAVAIGVALIFAAVLAFLMHRRGPRIESEAHPERTYSSSAVAQEIASLGQAHAWAGRYILSGGFTGDVVCVAPHSGFIRWHFWDVGPGGSEPELGDIVERDGVLHLVPTSTPDSNDGYVSSSNDFIPVAWGKHHYLIATSEVDELCRTVAAHQEPPWGQWLLRAGDEELPFEPDAAVQPSSVCR